MSNISYSIIIPHYNIPDLLVRCLNSIPVRKDIQVIVVDDCSPGADSYMARYPELSRPYLEFYSTPEGGSAGRARNVGLDYAKGKWVICMDADDLFIDDCFRILDESADRTEDILYYSYKCVYNDDLTKEANRNYFKSYFDHPENETLFRYSFDPMWGKVFKREMIEKYHIRCDEVRYGNDAAFSFKCGFYAKRIAIINTPLFIITEREGSLSSSDFSKKKISKEECEIRLEGALNIKHFCIRNNVDFKLGSYINRAVIYFKNYPSDFIYYYRTQILKKYDTIAYALPFYMVNDEARRMIKKLIRPLYRILKISN